MDRSHTAKTSYMNYGLYAALTKQIDHNQAYSYLYLLK